MLKRVRKDIAFPERELRRMQNLVNALADMEVLDKVAKDWKGNMRDLSYDMEECIDQLSFPKKAARQLKKLFARHDSRTQIKELKDRVKEEEERRLRLNLDKYAAIGPTRPVEIDPRLAVFHGVAKGLVAIDGPRDQLVSWLTEVSVELKVVAIVGGGGLGKTTLAMETSRKIGEHFQHRASVSVSRTPDLEKLLKDVLSQIDKDKFRECQSERWDEKQLIREIQLLLTGKRYFLVIDDVWKEQDWRSLKAVFPDNCNGSRIIITTRIANVAKSSCSNSGDHLYQMLPLNNVDSRRLFLRRIFHSDNSCPPQLQEVSTRILRKCGGLPLAIVTIASLLANKPQNLDEWERLQGSIGTGISYESDDGGNGMRHILLLSYWDLPHHLKTCLLYLCIYPEDKYIPCEELKRKWLAEGFIATKRGNVYQEAESCFNELVNRSLIQLVYADPQGYGFDQYCRVHDMVLDLIISLSDEENFATILNAECNSLPSKIHRISLQSSGNEHKGAIQSITRSKLHVRSLNVFGESKQIPPLEDFQSLRVLDICGEWEPENEHIRNIGSFYQLRYLRIKSRRITELHEDIGKLQNLETLDLRGSIKIRELPSTTARLQNLVRLFVSCSCVLSADMFGSMRALEEVADIHQTDNPEKFVEELGHLTKLRKITMTGSWTECYRERLRSSLNAIGSLQHLHTHAVIGEYMFRDPCCTFPHLQNLKLEYPMMRFPKGMAFLTNILKLDIEVYLFDDEDLRILMGMPSLANLQLIVSRSGGVLTVSGNGFKLLEVFHYTNQAYETTGIKFEAGAMPALRWLYLYWNNCGVPLRNNENTGMGFEHLSNHADLHVEISISRATLDELETVDCFVEKAIALHPNRHNLQLRLSYSS
ncbi:unnamed protein product [Triticum turgidum subsp. durum]|uniref:Uncharacterized protein n=1 Tax=Triticum turgidum subsp. durum TaxID=4567 RepID=A0A9R1ADX9_TRITD|nr:unnamed protein product [Triticum turgidum subsp. durum]